MTILKGLKYENIKTKFWEFDKKIKDKINKNNDEFYDKKNIFWIFKKLESNLGIKIKKQI